MDKLDILIKQAGSRPDIALVQVYGPLDTVASYTFNEKMQELIKNGIYKYIIDFEHLDYISSAGIGVFPGMALELQKNDGGVVFINVSEKIYKLFSVIGLTTLFSIKTSLQEALDEFESKEA